MAYDNYRFCIRDSDGTFGLDPSEQDLVCCGIESLRNLVDWPVHGTARLARYWAGSRFVYCMSAGLLTAESSWTYVRAEYASETMP